MLKFLYLDSLGNSTIAGCAISRVFKSFPLGRRDRLFPNRSNIEIRISSPIGTTTLAKNVCAQALWGFPPYLGIARPTSTTGRVDFSRPKVDGSAIIVVDDWCATLLDFVSCRIRYTGMRLLILLP